MNITITQKDIEKAKIQFSESGCIIDELAYSAGEYTSEQLYESNFDYEPSEPYNFDYETDLLDNTKTREQLNDIISKLDIDIPVGLSVQNESNLYAGAQMALNNKERFQELLEAYTEKLKEDRTDSISNEYNKQLQSELDDWYDDIYRAWLKGDRDYIGVVKSIARYFTDCGEGEYNKTNHEYTFLLNDYDIEKAKEEGYNKRQLKKWLLDSIYQSGEARDYRDKQERLKRKAERERLAEYRKEQAEKAENERIARLKTLTV